MTQPTMNEALDTARRTLEGALSSVYPDATGRLRDLETLAYASAQAVRYAAHERFGPEHPMTLAYRQIANETAVRAFEHTAKRIEEVLTPVAAGEMLREVPNEHPLHA